MFDSAVAYTRMLNAFTNIIQSFNPEHIMMDFEMAAIKSFRKTFPTANIHGCYFHFCQNVMKHVKSNGLESDYENDQKLSTVIRMLLWHWPLFQTIR